MKMIVGRKLSSAGGVVSSPFKISEQINKLGSAHRSAMPYQNGKKNNSENTARTTI